MVEGKTRICASRRLRSRGLFHCSGLIGALVLMFVSAYCGLSGTNALAQIRAQIGLTQYHNHILKLEWYAGAWCALAFALPFIAAILLGMGKRTTDAESSSYAVRLL